MARRNAALSLFSRLLIRMRIGMPSSFPGWRAAIPSVLLLSALIAFSACEEKAKPALSGITPDQLPTQESWNSSVTFSDSGRVRAILKAGHIRMFEEGQETLIDSGLVVDFYDRSGKHSSVLTAKRGHVDDRTRDLEAYENVVFRSDSGTVVETEYIFWDSAQKRVRGDRFVTITSAAERLQGYGFEADQDLRNYTVFGKVSGQAEIETK
ncbi:MAG: LPS export ABC transporter periplasmic protein LptC [Bacteroidetes bacterium]|nr:LPS export ABC transporter periplasmic protein LptC [Bacteroidota bacterium]